MAIEGSWSGMRKYLEKEMLAECLKDRVRYGCTSYQNMDGCNIFEICIDGKQIKRFSWETLNSYFIENNLKERSADIPPEISYWEGFHKIISEIPLQNRTEYTDEEFCNALSEYRNQDIKTSICSDNAIVKMFALLDRRVGKRTLEKIENDISQSPMWLQKIYKIRCESELHYANAQ